jgi:hypothetical protein
MSIFRRKRKGYNSGKDMVSDKDAPIEYVDEDLNWTCSGSSCAMYDIVYPSGTSQLYEHPTIPIRVCSYCGMWTPEHNCEFCGAPR